MREWKALSEIGGFGVHQPIRMGRLSRNAVTQPPRFLKRGWFHSILYRGGSMELTVTTMMKKSSPSWEHCDETL